MKHLVARERDVEEYDKLLSEVRACRNKTRETELIDELEAWESKFADLCKPLAFESKGEVLQEKYECVPVR